MPEYFAILIVVLTVVALVEEGCLRGPLFPNWKQRLAYFGSLWVLAIVWDWFEIWRGHWSYNSDLLICDPPILGIPVEDYLFCFVVPYLCAVVFRLVQRHTGP